MDSRTHIIFNIIVFVSIGIATIVTVISNPANILSIILFSLLLIASFIARRILNKKYAAVSKITILVDIILIYFITSNDLNRVWEVYFYLIVIDSIMLYELKSSVIFTFLSYDAYTAIRYIRYMKYNYFNWDYFSPALYDNLFFFIFIFGFTYIANRQIIQKKLLANTMEQLNNKTVQLEITNNKLKSTMETLEEITLLKERNRIAHEIHDTVGHTLTTVLVEMEAGKRLISRKPELAAEKIDLAQEQVRKGLDSIRYSVRNLQAGSELMPFTDVLKKIISETEKHALINISHDISPLPDLNYEQKKAILSSLQEGLTNAIKHGGCTQVKFKLGYSGNAVYFLMNDNGVGCENIMPGFGLTIMKERIENLGGCFEIAASDGKGCSLSFHFPFVCENMAVNGSGKV